MSFSFYCLFLSNVFNFHLEKKGTRSSETFAPFGKVPVLSSVPREWQGGHSVQLPLCSTVCSQNMGTWSNALDCGLSLVKEQENVAVLFPLYTWVGSLQTWCLKPKGKDLWWANQPCVTPLCLVLLLQSSDAFWPFWYFHLKVCGDSKVHSVMLKFP